MMLKLRYHIKGMSKQECISPTTSHSRIGDLDLSTPMSLTICPKKVCHENQHCFLATGENPAVDFETKMYTESLDVLEHHIKPLRRVPGVVLEQAYLNKMAEGLKPLEALAYTRSM